jgi:flagellar biosynthesis protein FliR
MEASCQLVTAMPPGIEWDMTSASATIVQLLQDCFSFALQAGSPLVVAVVAAGIIAATIARFVRHFATVVAGLNLGLISILIALFLLLPLYEILVTEKATDASEALSQVFHRTER